VHREIRGRGNVCYLDCVDAFTVVYVCQTNPIVHIVCMLVYLCSSKLRTVLSFQWPLG
jgi:hypothetical protein